MIRGEPGARLALAADTHRSTAMKATSSRTADDSTLDVLQAPARDTEAVTGDWFALVQAHHAMIEQSFDELLASAADPSQRALLFKRLAYLLTAHSVAEENVLYPALSMVGLPSESDRLYIDQAHAKVMNAMLDLADDKLGDEWVGRASELRDAVLKHAKVDEEGDLYPRLQAAIDPATATKLSMAYRREFMAVKPA